MNKWADYGISEVKFRDDDVHILQVKVHEDTGTSFGAVSIIKREDVVSYIERGKTFCTILKKDDKWTKGADVGIVVINGVKFIRTDNNQTPKDNLGELPQF